MKMFIFLGNAFSGNVPSLSFFFFFKKGLMLQIFHFYFFIVEEGF